MLANHLGAFHAQEFAEIGYYPILSTAAAQELGAFPQHVYQWHREGFGLAHGARLLATSTGAFPNQAFSYGSAIAVQFHPEITYAQLHRWTGHNSGAPRHEGRTRAPRAHGRPPPTRAQAARLARKAPSPLGRRRAHQCLTPCWWIPNRFACL
jgi:GMP synthase (glutamine-hydrolysing)